MTTITAQIIGRGVKGEKGDQGIQGPQGVQGVQGVQGLKGDTGNNGITPVKGLDYFTDLEKDEMVQREDEITGIHYRTGVSNGVIFMEEV